MNFNEFNFYGEWISTEKDVKLTISSGLTYPFNIRIEKNNSIEDFESGSIRDVPKNDFALRDYKTKHYRILIVNNDTIRMYETKLVSLSPNRPTQVEKAIESSLVEFTRAA